MNAAVSQATPLGNRPVDRRRETLGYVRRSWAVLCVGECGVRAQGGTALALRGSGHVYV
jgi:hypothetical protein